MENEIKTGSYPGAPPKPYYARMSTYWWLGRWVFLKFILRELSSLFVAGFVLLILLLVRAVILGPDAYARFQQSLREPLIVIFNCISFCFVLFHAITWFNLAPSAMTLRLGGKKIPDRLIAGSNYAAWLAISAILAWLILRSGGEV